jgi:hypothetical protein
LMTKNLDKPENDYFVASLQLSGKL